MFFREVIEDHVAQPPHVLLVERRDRDGAGRDQSCAIARGHRVADPVHLVEHSHAGLIADFELGQHLLGDLELLARLRRACVHHVHQ